MFNKVAIVVVGENLVSRDIIVRRHDCDNLQRICKIHRSYNALQYSEIFCQGENRYNLLIKIISPLADT